MMPDIQAALFVFLDVPLPDSPGLNYGFDKKISVKEFPAAGQTLSMVINGNSYNLIVQTYGPDDQKTHPCITTYLDDATEQEKIISDLLIDPEWEESPW